MSYNLAICPVCGGNEIEREECVNCGTPLSRFIGRPRHGGLRNPKGGRPPKSSEKYIDIHLKVPPRQAEWLKQNREQTGKAINAFIVEAIAEKIEREAP